MHVKKKKVHGREVRKDQFVSDNVPEAGSPRALPKHLIQLRPPAFQNLEVSLERETGWACCVSCSTAVNPEGQGPVWGPGGRTSGSCLTWLRPDSARGQSHLLWPSGRKKQGMWFGKEAKAAAASGNAT